MLKRHDPIVRTQYPAKACRRIPHAISPKSTDKDYDKCGYLFYFDETMIKRSYLNMDNEALAFNQ